MEQAREEERAYPILSSLWTTPLPVPFHRLPTIPNTQTLYPSTSTLKGKRNQFSPQSLDETPPVPTFRQIFASANTLTLNPSTRTCRSTSTSPLKRENVANTNTSPRRSMLPNTAVSTAVTLVCCWTLRLCKIIQLSGLCEIGEIRKLGGAETLRHYPGGEFHHG